MVIVAFCFLYLGDEKEGNPGSVQEQEDHAVVELAWASAFRSGMRVGCQKEIVFIIHSFIIFNIFPLW